MAGNVDRAIILVVLPLNALMRDQISKLNERGLTSFMVQGRSVQVEDKSAQWSRYSKKPFLRYRDAGWDVRHL